LTKIQTLREDVYKKIAAGEVVERPLSVVKELVENAIDAGADAITVEVMEGGKRAIKVIDNGSGFAPDDIETAFKNHSTSKITELTDFDRLDTLGFRGEALPSILEVSQIELKTSDNSKGQGVYCLFQDAKLQEKRDIACNQGTTFTVKELFYNFPVRKKFLKTDRTELNQIISFLEPIALVNYNKSFELKHNGKTVFSYKKVSQLKDRIYQVFGKEFLENLHEVNYQHGQYHVCGFVSKLNTGVSVKKHQYFFVNRRSVREKTLIAGLNNTFQRFLEKHKHPAAILLLSIPPREVDVNIHPMKLEIKFVDSSGVYQLIKRAIEDSFGTVDQYEYIPDFSRSPQRGASTSSKWEPTTSAGPGPGPGAPATRRHDSAGQGGGGSFGGSRNNFQSQQPSASLADSIQGQQPIPSDSQPQASHPDEAAQSQLFPGQFLDRDGFKLIGQYKDSYIIIEKDGQLLIVDQHNAQERVNFDQLKKEYNEEKINSVLPLFPVIMELSPSEASLLDSNKLEVLAKLGFRLEPLTGNSYDIKAFPQVLGERNIKEAVREVIHLKEKDDDINFEDSVLAQIACKSAIKVNHKLFPEQMKTIVTNLFKTENPYFCPHKRPIIIEFTLEQIEKMMKRR